MLAARSLIKLQILVDLGFLLSLRRLVERELDPTVSIGDDLGHQRRVLGGDRLVVEGDQLGETEDVGVVLDPLVHGAELDVADAVIDVLESNALSITDSGEGNEAGHERTLVVLALD